MAGSVLSETIIPKAEGRAFELQAGQVLRLTALAQHTRHRGTTVQFVVLNACTPGHPSIVPCWRLKTIPMVSTG